MSIQWVTGVVDHFGFYNMFLARVKQECRGYVEAEQTAKKHSLRARLSSEKQKGGFGI